MGAIVWPLERNLIRRRMINHTFGLVRHHPNGTLKAHTGWDFTAPIGTPCFALADGIIALVYGHTDTVGFGLTSVIKFSLEDGTTYFAAYCHLSEVLLDQGQNVYRGDMIGLTGATGNAKGQAPEDNHLHFEIRDTVKPGPGLKDRQDARVVFGPPPMSDWIFESYTDSCKAQEVSNVVF